MLNYNTCDLCCTDQASRAQIGKANNVTANAAFKSKSQRESMNTGDAKLKPAPCKCNPESLPMVSTWSSCAIYVMG